MRRKTIVFSLLVPLGCLVILVATPNTSSAQLGARLFGGAGKRGKADEPPPKPPAPPMGVTIHPPQAPKPLPDPIPGPPVPKLGATSQRPSHDEAAGEKTELTPEMAELRDSVRRTLVSYYNRPVSTQSNTPGDLIYFCMVFGPEAEVRTGSSATNRVNGVASLCSNTPCSGYYLLNSDGRHFIPRIGYGLQTRSGDLLAMLAMAGVSSDYEIRMGDARGTVADLVQWEQLDIRSGSDLSLTTVGLAFYLPDDATWQNSRGETWSLDKLADEELNRRVAVTSPAAVDRLIGLTYLADRGRKLGTPTNDRLAQIEQYLESWYDHALKLQNADGTWSPYFFGYRGTSRDTVATLRSTGHILEWLAMSLPKDRLEDPQIVNALEKVNSILAGQASRAYLAAMSPEDVATYMRALHALSIYNQRVFRPCDPPAEPEPESEPEADESKVAVHSQGL